MLLIEIGMLIGGIYAIVFAKVPSFLVSGGKYQAEGLVARWVGVLLLLPLPIIFLGNTILPLLFGEDGTQYTIMLEIITVLGVAVLSVVLVRVVGKRVEPVNNKEATTSTQRTGIRIWLRITSTVFGGMFVVLSFPLLIASVMMFDSPGSQGNPPTVLLFWSVISFPILCLFSIVGSWVLYRFTKDTAARLVSLLPLVSVLLFLAGWFWLDMSCGGNFDCHIDPPTMQEQGNTINASECALPTLDGGDSLGTTGCGVLKVGVIVTGITSNTTEAHNWQFSAQNRKQFTITIESDGSCPQISILDSSGSVIESFKDENKIYLCPSGMTTTSFFHFDPPAIDTYILHLTTPATPGTYWLKIE